MVTDKGSVLKSYPSGLDNWYPFAQNSQYQTFDYPRVNLDGWIGYSALGEVADSFNATMYLMWDPTLPGQGQAQPCSAASNLWSTEADNWDPTPSTCTGSIPVPIAFTNWGYRGDAINTLQYQMNNGTTWMLNCPLNPPAPPTPTVTPTNPKAYNFGYPFWTSVAYNGAQ
jgi:hypothetical protein